MHRQFDLGLDLRNRSARRVCAARPCIGLHRATVSRSREKAPINPVFDTSARTRNRRSGAHALCTRRADQRFNGGGGSRPSRTFGLQTRRNSLSERRAYGLHRVTAYSIFCATTPSPEKHAPLRQTFGFRTRRTRWSGRRAYALETQAAYSMSACRLTMPRESATRDGTSGKENATLKEVAGIAPRGEQVPMY